MNYYSAFIHYVKNHLEKKKCSDENWLRVFSPGFKLEWKGGGKELCLKSDFIMELQSQVTDNLRQTSRCY